jgi:uncharacterized protein
MTLPRPSGAPEPKHAPSPPDSSVETGGFFERLLSLAESLRSVGVEVSTGEVIDAAVALGHLELDDRATFKAALRSVMVKSPLGADRFDRLFDLTFRAGQIRGSDELTNRSADRSAIPGTDQPTRTPTGLSKDILDALSRGDADQLRALAAQAVELAAGIESGEGSENYFLHRVLRAIDLSRMLSAALQQARRGGEMSELELALHRSELTELLEEFRRQLAAQIAARLHERHVDVDLAAGVADPSERDILHLSSVELAELRRTVQPLARQLAARIGRRRKLHSTGRLDPRRTIRRSLDTGGVPIDVVNRRRHPNRPEIVLLCDVSGSVVEFAQFTFSLVNAIHEELSRVRSFAFVDGVGEVTDLFASATYDIPVARFIERRGVLGPDGHSDYGRVFREFAANHLSDAVNSRTTLIVTGDGRSNYRPADASAFRQIADQARRVYWLNPEAEARWNADDSIVDEFAPHCDGMFAVQTLRELADVIAELV